MAAVPSIGRASLVEAPARAPQAAATAGLYERHSAKILSYCLHQLGSREEAEDAVQTTFMNAFRALGRGVVPESESAWLFKIAENVCLSRRRSSWRRGRIESPSDFDIIEEIVPGPSLQRDELIGIEDALASMPEQQRRAILLREWQGLSYREIADELEVSQSAVETLIFRARRSLANGLEQPDLVKKPKRKSFRRALHMIDIGTIAAAVKTVVAGSVAVKATAAAVAVTAAAGTTASVKVEGHSPTAAAPIAIAAPAPARARPKTVTLAAQPAVATYSGSFTPASASQRNRAAEERLSVPKAISRPAAPAKPRPAAASPARSVPAAAPAADAPVAAPAAPAEQSAPPGPEESAKPHAIDRPAPAPAAEQPKREEKLGRGGKDEEKGKGKAVSTALAPAVETATPAAADMPAAAAPTPAPAADEPTRTESKQERRERKSSRNLAAAPAAAAEPAVSEAELTAATETPEATAAPATEPAPSDDGKGHKRRKK